MNQTIVTIESPRRWRFSVGPFPSLDAAYEWVNTFRREFPDWRTSMQDAWNPDKIMAAIRSIEAIDQLDEKSEER